MRSEGWLACIRVFNDLLMAFASCAALSIVMTCSKRNYLLIYHGLYGFVWVCSCIWIGNDLYIFCMEADWFIFDLIIIVIIITSSIKNYMMNRPCLCSTIPCGPKAPEPRPMDRQSGRQVGEWGGSGGTVQQVTGPQVRK